MRNLIDGFFHFKQHVFPRERQLFRSLGAGQHPEALFITCADSHIVPDLITQSRPGDLFVCRTIGNQIPAHGAATEAGVASAVEYALEALEIRHIIVCGHSDCGAMKAVLHPEKAAGLPAVGQWLRHADAARSVVLKNYQDASDEVLLHMLTEENIVVQLQNLSTHPSVAAKLAQGNLQLHGWNYHIHSGEITSYDAKPRAFRPLQPDTTAGAPGSNSRSRFARVSPGDAA